MPPAKSGIRKTSTKLLSVAAKIGRARRVEVHGATSREAAHRQVLSALETPEGC